jgi:hypothetical protein
MNSSFRFAWLFVAALILVNVAILRGRLWSMVAESRITETESRQIIRIVCFALVVPAIVVGVVYVWAFDSTICSILPFTSVNLGPLVTSYIIVCWWLMLLITVWFSDALPLLLGVRAASSVAPRGKPNWGSHQVRVATTALILVVAVGSISARVVLRQIAPDFASCTNNP